MLHKRNPLKTKKVMTLQSRITFGKKYLGKTIEEVCDVDTQYIEWCLNSDMFNLDRNAKIYLAARKNGRSSGGFKGIIDYGPRDIDLFIGLPSQQFYTRRENE